MKLTPAMYQYMENKELYPDCIIMFRMGDFYEMFYEDAKIAAKELGITLTSRGQGETKAPLAGIPYHALTNYLGKFVKKGYKIAICEQLEDPKLAKGVVKRGVVRIVTPGTLIEDNVLDKSTNNYIISVFQDTTNYGISICDVTTGQFVSTEIESPQKIIDQLTIHTPTEIVISESFTNKEIEDFCKQTKVFVNRQPEHSFFINKAQNSIFSHFNTTTLNQFNLHDKDLATCSAGALLEYLKKTQMTDLTHIRTIKLLNTKDFIELDSATLRNLEILRNLIDNSSEGTLLNIINKTTTPMGARKLRYWLTHPLINKEKIEERLDLVEFLTTDFILTEELKTNLENIFDLERLTSKIVYKTANARDLNTIKTSLQTTLKLIELLKPTNKFNFLTQLHIPIDLITAIDNTLKEEVPLTVREGNMIKQGYNQELDSLREIRTNSKNILKQIEEQEITKTGIASLRIRYNRVFGYFIEITNRHKDKVPASYIRKQTLVNNERYITEELKQLEDKILTAEDKIVEIEFNLFSELLNQVATHITDIQKIADSISTLDCLVSFSVIAKENNYTKPKITEEFDIELLESRHPVIEKLTSPYIPNDFKITRENKIMVITGPNMSGKSTIMRQVALSVLLAQIGSFVPAKRAVIGIVDKIFTRIGAYDDLAGGRSTFMVEMNETANILHNASEKSLILLDELGRGTSTFDGISIAWAVCEYLVQQIGAKALFATHYHQLNKLSERYKGVKNYNVLVKESDDNIIFLRKFVEGSTDKSYGIHVAKLAGLPDEVIKRSQMIISRLETEDRVSDFIYRGNLKENKKLTKFFEQ